MRILNSLLLKLKLVYVPFVAVSIGAILFYGLFRWLFDFKLGLLPLKEDVFNIWIPGLLAPIAIFIWIRPRVRVLDLNRRGKDGQYPFLLVLMFAMAFPIGASQFYLEETSFDLIALGEANELESFRKQKYFSLRSFQIDHKACAAYFEPSVSGRFNDSLSFGRYFVCPFKGAENAWYGFRYHRTVDNNIDDEKKLAAYKDFIAYSDAEFASYDFYKLSYFEKVANSSTRDGYLEAANKGGSSAELSKVIVLERKFGDVNRRLESSFSWFWGTSLFFATLVFFMVLCQRLNDTELDSIAREEGPKNDDLSEVLSFLDPRGINGTGGMLVLLNVAVFVVLVFFGLDIASPTAKQLLEVGGNRRFEVLNGDYWRLFTSVFIHGGIMHLLMNLIGLVLGAMLLEGVLGRVKLIASYVVCGVLASVASIFWHESTVSVGASGAIFGLFGLVFVFAVTQIYPVYARGPVWLFLVGYVATGLLFGLLIPGIDNAAHIGGLVSGAFIGCVLVLVERKKLKHHAHTHRVL